MTAEDQAPARNLQRNLSKSDSGHTRMADRLKGLADRLAFAVLLRLPTDVVSDIGARLALARGPTVYREAHERSLANLKLLRPELSDDERQAMAMARWDNIGRLMTEFAVLERLMREGRVTIEGQEHLAAARAAANGRGMIMLGLHLGNWEVCSPALASLGVEMTAFYEPPVSRSRDRISRAVRARLGVELVAPEQADVRPAIRALAAGKHLGVFGDESPRGKVRAPFFGRPTDIGGNLANVVRFARRTGSVILPGYILRVRKARFRGILLPPIVLEDEATPGARLLDDVQRLNGIIEPLIRAHADQWYYLHDVLG